MQRPIPLEGAAHVALRDLLHAARAHENASTGAHRRPAFRMTRALLHAAHAAGFSFHDMARALDVSEWSVRARAHASEPIEVGRFLQLTGRYRAALSDVIRHERPEADGILNSGELLAWYLDVVARETTGDLPS